MEAVDGESAVRGLLVTLLNLFNVDSGSTLSRLHPSLDPLSLGISSLAAAIALMLCVESRASSPPRRQ